MADHLDRYRANERRLWARHGLAPAERWIGISSTSARLRLLEVGDGPSVVFLHGALNAGSGFAPLAGRLADFRCILVDLPGSGLSGPLHAVDPPGPAIVAMLECILDAAGLDRVAVVGSSFGGACSLWLAGARPERVTRLVLEGCPALVDGMRLTPSFRLLASGMAGRFVAHRRTLFCYPGQMMGQIGHAASARAGRIEREWLEWYRALALDTPTMSGGTALLQQVADRHGLRRDLTFQSAFLGAIRQPTLVLWGEDDPFAGVDVGRRAAGALPHATFRSFAASGHLPWLDDPVEHARLIRDFLAASGEPIDGREDVGGRRGASEPAAVG